MDPHDKTGGRAGYSFILVFMVLAVSIAASGVFFYGNYKKRFRDEIDRQLSAIAELKVSELVGWRTERLGDASIFYKNASFSGLVRRFFEKPDDPAVRDQLRTWLSHVLAAYEYNRVFLLDVHGVERMSAPDTPEPVAAHLLEQGPEILRSGRITFMDFHRDAPDGPIHMSALVPVLDGGDNTRAMGILILRIDPEKYLYPFISRWPTGSRTAETLIVRRDGNDALYLNELRFQKNTALNLRIPLGRKDVAGVKAVLGQEGVVECVDYRGVQVLAALRAVPDSPWFLVARMDIAEAYAPLRTREWVIIALVGSLILGAGGGTGFIWRHQRARFYREKYEAVEALRESEERFRTLYENSTLGLYRTTTDGRIVLANPALLKMLGYSSFDELSSRDLKTDGFEPSYPRAQFVERVEREGAVRGLESAWKRRDGTTVFVRESARAIRDPEGRTVYFDGTVEDVTDRKRAEERLNETLQRLRLAITSTVRVIGMMVEARDPYTAGHQQKTTILAEAIAVEMGLSAERIEGLRMAGQVHDLGKISIPAEILSKPTRLTPGEFNLVKTHSQKGYEILKDVEFPWPLAEIVCQHHERMNGTGYPRGLKGDEIVMEARILAVSDTVEAMAANRPYRPAPGLGVALEEIDKNKGVLYDPDVAAACLKLFKEKGFRFEDQGSPT